MTSRHTPTLLCFIIISILCIYEVSSNDLTAPDEFQARFTTTVQQGDGEFVVHVKREWSPNGVDRFYTLLQPETYYYDNNGFFRVVPNFVVQWGINGDPAVTAEWENATIPDDPVIESNVYGWMSFATAGPNTRTTQLYINYANNSRLDSQGFSPFAYVISGMDVVEAIYAGYEQQPNQDLITKMGNAYLEAEYPLLDYIITARVIGENNTYSDVATSSAFAYHLQPTSSSSFLILIIILSFTFLL